MLGLVQVTVILVSEIATAATSNGAEKKTKHMSYVRFRLWLWVMVFNITFNNISVVLWLSVLLGEETRVPVENQQPIASH